MIIQLIAHIRTIAEYGPNLMMRENRAIVPKRAQGESGYLHITSHK